MVVGVDAEVHVVSYTATQHQILFNHIRDVYGFIEPRQIQRFVWYMLKHRQTIYSLLPFYRR